jgi:hypothetical protein
MLSDRAGSVNERAQAEALPHVTTQVNRAGAEQSAVSASLRITERISHLPPAGRGTS